MTILIQTQKTKLIYLGGGRIHQQTNNENDNIDIDNMTILNDGFYVLSGIEENRIQIDRLSGFNIKREGGQFIYYRGSLYLFGGYSENRLRERTIEQYKLTSLFNSSYIDVNSNTNEKWKVLNFQLWEGLTNMKMIKGYNNNEVLIIGGSNNRMDCNMKVYKLDIK